MEVGSRNAHLDGAMRQNTGSARPARQDRRVKPDGAVMQGPEASSAIHASQTPAVAPPAGTGVRSIHRTAVYGPVCTVVWEGRSREAPPYPDLCTRYWLEGGSPLASASQRGRIFNSTSGQVRRLY
jgi:hypothetical protein